MRLEKVDIGGCRDESEDSKREEEREIEEEDMKLKGSR